MGLPFVEIHSAKKVKPSRILTFTGQLMKFPFLRKFQKGKLPKLWQNLRRSTQSSTWENGWGPKRRDFKQLWTWMHLNQLKYRTNQGPMSLKHLNTFSTTFQKINSGLKKKNWKIPYEFRYTVTSILSFYSYDKLFPIKLYWETCNINQAK